MPFKAGRLLFYDNVSQNLQSIPESFQSSVCGFVVLLGGRAEKRCPNGTGTYVRKWLGGTMNATPSCESQSNLLTDV